MSTNHTPTPYIQLLRHDGVPFGIASRETMRHDSDSLCLLPSGGMGFDAETVKANAEFICRACNSHAALVEALEDAVIRMNRARRILTEDKTGNWGMLDTSKARELLASAKEAEPQKERDDDGGCHCMGPIDPGSRICSICHKTKR